jgi:hypothetical protein
MMVDLETQDIWNVSLNATVEAILLFLEYVEHQGKEASTILKTMSNEELGIFGKLPVERRGVIRHALSRVDAHYSKIVPKIDREKAQRLETARQHLVQAMLSRSAPAFESAIGLISKILEGLLKDRLRMRAMARWGAGWAQISEKELGLSVPIERLSYGGIKHALATWNEKFTSEAIVPQDFIRRIDFFRIARVISTHDKGDAEETKELAAFKKSWDDYDIFEGDLLYAIDNGLYVMEKLVGLDEGGIRNTDEYAREILASLEQLVNITNKGFRDTRREHHELRETLNQVDNSIRLISEESPERLRGVVREEMSTMARAR